MTNYLKYIHGKAGKADPKKSKVYIGWVNQQGGQVVIGGLATAGAQLAVKYVNDQLGGVGGHPVALVKCFIKSSGGGRHDLRAEARQRQADHRGRGGRRRHREPSRSTRRSAATKPIDHRRRHHPGRTEHRRPASSSSATARTSSLPFGNYAKNVLHAKTAAVVYPNVAGHRGVGAGDREGLKDAGIARQAGRLRAGPDRPDRAAHSQPEPQTADFVIPYSSASGCANQAKALKQLGITDAKKIVTAPLCLNPTVIAAPRRLADSGRTRSRSSLYGDPTDKGMPAYDRR